MGKNKKTITIIYFISIGLSILASIVIVGYIIILIIFGMNFANPSKKTYSLHTSLRGDIVREITDSLNTVEWKHNLPKNRKDSVILDIDSQEYFYYFNTPDTILINWTACDEVDNFSYKSREEITETIIIGIKCYDYHIKFENIYTDTSCFPYDRISDTYKRKYEYLFLQTICVDIEQEALKRNLPYSKIYLGKDQLKSYGYYELANRIYGVTLRDIIKELWN
jgi:hypothetical protein